MPYNEQQLEFKFMIELPLNHMANHQVALSSICTISKAEPSHLSELPEAHTGACKCSPLQA
eukprot:1512972-Pleurochrysis_carterae.AAC.1